MSILTSRHDASDLHHNLNQLIICRLPLCLPPYASTPQLYALGLSRFAQVYFTFESAWLGLIKEVDPSAPASKFIGDDHGGINHVLRQIYIPEILRSDRLRSDLSKLTLWTATDLTVENERNGMAARNFVSHINDVIQHKPHVLLAYTWIMYMALFNGGRWIRGKLMKGGREYWENGAKGLSSLKGRSDAAPVNSEEAHPCLSFWLFDGAQDGEAIKRDFKARLRQAANSLTEPERIDVISEARKIFNFCEEIILELDVEASIERCVSSSSSPCSPKIDTTTREAPCVDYLRSLLIGIAGVLLSLCLILASEQRGGADSQPAAFKGQITQPRYP